MQHVVVDDSNIGMGGVDQRVVPCGRERSACFVICDIAIHRAVAIRKFAATQRGKWLAGIRVSADKGRNEGHRALRLVQCTLVRPINHILKFTERHFWRGFPIIGRRTSNMFRELTCIHTYILYIHAYIHIHACIHTYIYTIHSYILYTHTYIHIYIHTYSHR
jgi:hypothetical protein